MTTMDLYCFHMSGEKYVPASCPAPEPDWLNFAMVWGGRVVLFTVAFIVLRMVLKSSLFTVRQQSVAIVERLGRYRKTATPGLNFKFPIIDKVVIVRWLRIMQLVIEADTKTKDNVFLVAHVSVQHRILPERASDSWYQLQDAEKQMTSFVLNEARAEIPLMTLDEVFAHKEQIAIKIKASLSEKMKGYGYEITDVLIPEIDPDAKVKAAMNEIQAQQRLQIAAEAKGAANKILIVKSAEAEAESKALQGKGIADQRTAIANGLKEAVSVIAAASGVDRREVLTTVMLTQYLDTMKEIGVSAGSKVILLPHSPAGMADLMGQIRNAVAVGAEMDTDLRTDQASK